MSNVITESSLGDRGLGFELFPNFDESDGSRCPYQQRYKDPTPVCMIYHPCSLTIRTDIFKLSVPSNIKS